MDVSYRHRGDTGRRQGGGSTLALHQEAATDTARSGGAEEAGHIAPSAQMAFGKP
jgi:hypothetical protein